MPNPTSPVGFVNGCASAWNADFSGSLSPAVTNGLQSNGQIWVGTTTPNANNTNINVLTLTAGTGVTITQSATTLTIGLAGGGTAVEHLTGNTGGQLNPDGSNNFNIITANSTVKVAGSGSTLTVDFGLQNLLLGSSGSITSGGNNVGIGSTSLAATAAGGSNVAMGTASLFTNVGGSSNTAIGNNSLKLFNPGAGPTFTRNTALGNNSLQALTTGTDCIGLGNLAGSSYTSSESSNICIGNTGTLAESNTIHIGTQGAGSGQQNTCFIAGITGVSVSNKNIATLNTSTGQMGSDATVALAQGGTNAALTASNGGIFYSTATAGAILSGTATAGQMLQSGASTAPTWSTSTYPATNAVSTLLYASSANVMAALSTANNGVLITSGGGVPSISSTLPTAVQGNITSVGNLGNQTNTTRCCVQAYKSSATTNNTGDGTTYTLIFDTVVSDQGSNYNSGTGTFTAPVTGKYLFTVNITLTGLSTAATRVLNTMVPSAGNSFLFNYEDPGIAASALSVKMSGGSFIASIASGTTCTITTQVSNTTKTVGVDGGADSRTQLSIFLLC